MNQPTRIEAEILRLATARGPDRSICPTEVARALLPDPGDAWRRQLDLVRRAAARLAQAGDIDILRKGRPIDPATMKGVIRLRIRPAAPRPSPPDASSSAECVPACGGER
jgi:hypothetical protein